MKRAEFINMLEKNPQLKKDLFIRGFLITDKRIKDTSTFPFYGNWKIKESSGYYFMAHNLTGMHLYVTEEGNTFFIMGHAYNPFTKEYEEEKILAHIAEAYGTSEYMERVNDITGVFVYGSIVNGRLEYLVDPSGMQSACYGKLEENFYLSSHPQLIGDLCYLKMDDFVKELIQYKWYGRVMGPYLPGDLTSFSEVKRIVPSILYRYDGKVSHKRYWPLKDMKMATEEKEYRKIIQ